MIKKEIIFSILTIIFSSIFALLLLEIALRIAVKNPNLKVKIFPTNVGWNKDDFNKLHEEIYAKQWQLKKLKILFIKVMQMNSIIKLTPMNVWIYTLGQNAILRIQSLSLW